jgi:PAS domain S-box-containing protein
MERSLEAKIGRSRERLELLRRQVEREGVRPESPLAEAVEELGHTLEELSVTLEELETANEGLAQARQEAAEHALRYQGLFRSAPDAYLVTDARGVIREANQAAEAKLGREARYLVGKPLLVFAAKEHRRALERHLLAMQGGRESGIADWEPRFAPGRTEPFWASVTAQATRADDGTVREIRWLLRDQTEQRQRRRLQDVRDAAAAAALAEDRERRRLAQDLHDDIGQLLALASLKLGELRDSTAGGAEQTNVREIEELVAQAHGHAESLSFQLSPPILHDQGFVAAAEWLAEDLTHRYDLSIEFADDGQPKPLDEAIRIALFRALRELLINVARHARTRQAHVRIWRDGERVRVEVRDHGLGFDPAEASKGFGLVSVRERLRNLGGDLEIDSAPGEGTRVVAHAPLSREDPP